MLSFKLPDSNTRPNWLVAFLNTFIQNVANLVSIHLKGVFSRWFEICLKLKSLVKFINSMTQLSKHIKSYIFEPVLQNFFFAHFPILTGKLECLWHIKKNCILCEIISSKRTVKLCVKKFDRMIWKIQHSNFLSHILMPW